LEARGSGSASGKAILLGEHAVVYGAPALVVGIDRGATASARHTHGRSELALGNVTVAAGEDSDLARAFAALLAACEATEPIHVEARTELPAGAGLGCSAALGVAIVRALDALLGREPRTPTEVAYRAAAWERVFHGNPSGVDAAAASRGGCLFYQRHGAGGSPCPDDPLLSEAKIRPVALGAPLTLVIGHSGVASSTRDMVEQVARLRERKQEVVDRTVVAIDALVRNARLALEAGDVTGLGKLMDLNQMLLAGWMLSTEEIENMCRLAREAGALGAKLTGSGGGGCVVALVGDDPEPVLRCWEDAGHRSFPTRVQPTPSRAAEAEGRP
jgi:mevalonate kinase